MKLPRFRLSTLCLFVALVAVTLAWSWQSVENQRLRVEAELSRAVYDQARAELAAAYAQSDQVVKQYEANAAKLEALEESTKRALDEQGIEPPDEP
jgi:oligoribonuclease NrnB/cAMP/cGMP phosphodiesterase (DHH superfamily)